MHISILKPNSLISSRQLKIRSGKECTQIGLRELLRLMYESSADKISVAFANSFIDNTLNSC